MLRSPIGSIGLFSALFLFCPSALLSAQQPAPHPKLDGPTLGRAHLMLHQAYEEVRNNYYDTSFHGVDLDKTYHQFDQRLDSSQSINETFRVIAGFLLSLHDSHAFFQPPVRSNRSTPGFFMQIIGDKCFVTRIRPGTDAAGKLRVGDQVLALNGFTMMPADFHEMEYFIQILSPSPSETLDVRSPSDEPRREIVNVKFRTGRSVLDMTGGDGGGDFWQLVRDDEDTEHHSRSRYLETGDTMIWRMPTFEVNPADLEKSFNKAAKHQNLILDLRGNSGGYADTLTEMLGHFFDHEIKLGDRVTRKGTKPEMIKPFSPRFTGKVTVLIDHNSASAAELFARVLQLEHRGTILGDRSAGAVMEARAFSESTGTDYQVYYGLSITSANMLMTDGKSLENVGVTPDEIMLPAAADLAQGRDPVLAHAATLYNVKLDPEAAGKLFPFEWPSL